MPEDTYYPEPDDQQETIAKAQENQGEIDEYSTGLLPKELFGDDIQPGDTITVKVKRVLDDEVEVALPENDNEREESSEADREIDAMAEVTEE